MRMRRIVALGVLAVAGSVVFAETARAECQIADAKLEEAILQSPGLRGTSNRQAVRDLRSLRDAAFTLRSYGRHEDCERLLGNIRELIAGPAMGTLGDNDEEEADKQSAAREPKVQRGRSVGTRSDKNAKPLIKVDELVPALLANEIVGSEVRSSDDKIIGEVRNVVLGTKDRRDYAIVASGGFFIPGKESYVIPLRFLKVTIDRESFFTGVPHAKLSKGTLMPDQNYRWMTDRNWLAKNDAFFAF